MGDTGLTGGFCEGEALAERGAESCPGACFEKGGVARVGGGELGGFLCAFGKTDAEAYALLKELGLPFKNQNN